MCEGVAWVGYGLGVQRRDGLCSQRWICLPAWRHWDWTEELNNLGPYKAACKVGGPGADRYSTAKQRMTNRECWPRGISVVSRPRATMTEPFLKAVLRPDSTSRTSVVWVRTLAAGRLEGST
jgi:hypothetical protein